MKIGPKYKICKRLGGGIFEKCQTQKFALAEERAARNRRRGPRGRAPSDFGRQLLEKQKVRYSYGLSDKQLARYVKEATVEKGTNPADKLHEKLETRLDNVVYRLGLASTRAQARQLVSHGHITVGGRKVTIPSHQVGNGDIIAIREGSRNRPFFSTLPERIKEYQAPSWLSFDVTKMSGTRAGTPTREVSSSLDLRTVFEYYSR